MNNTNRRPQESDPITETGLAALLAMRSDLPFTPSQPAAPTITGPVADRADPEGVRMDTALARTFMLAGNATFTVVSKNTGKRFTFKLSRPKQENSSYRTTRKPIFVKVLTGPQNTSDYEYIGQIWEDAEKFTYSVGRKARIGADAPSQQAALWLTKALNNPALLAQCDVYHAGSCGRCGRKLTVPSSILSGIGPECATRM